MCYNCGCGLPDDAMGSDQSITQKTFKQAADAFGMSELEAMQETAKLLKKEIEKMEKQIQTNPK